MIDAACLSASRSICQGKAEYPSLMLGLVPTVISVSVNGLAHHPVWIVVQRWLMATVLAGLAVRMATEARR